MSKSGTPASCIDGRFGTSGERSLGGRGGQKYPCHDVMSNPGTPASGIEGGLGTGGERSWVVPASARSAPPFTWGSPVSTSINIMVMRPPITSFSAGGELLYGTC